jgi:hypothetical protein
MIVAHKIWMDDTIFFGKTEGNRNVIGPSFRYFNQGLQEFEIRNLMVMRMVSSVFHLLSNAFCTTFTLYVPQTTWLAVKHSNCVFCTSNNFFLLICLHIPYMVVYIGIKCILNDWENFTSEFLTSKQRKVFNIKILFTNKCTLLLNT